MIQDINAHPNFFMAGKKMEKFEKELLALLPRIQHLAEHFFTTRDEKTKHHDAITIMASLLNMLSRFAEHAGPSSAQDRNHQRIFLTIVAGIEAVYKVTDANPRLLDLSQGQLNQAADIMSRHKWFVQLVVDNYLLDTCWQVYEKSVHSRKAINDVLFLAIRPSLSISDSAADEIKGFYRLVRDELSQLPFPKGYHVSRRWRQITDHLISMVGHLEHSVHTAVLGMHGSPFFIHVRPLDDNGASLLTRQYEQFRDQYPEIAAIGESELALPGTTVHVGNVRLSEGFLQCMNFYTEIVSKLNGKTSFEVIVEIGSGYGRLARLFNLSRRCKCYVLVDLPESLMFAYSFLKANLPDASCHVIRSAADVTSGIVQQFDFIFCPVQNIRFLDIGKVNLVVNTWSLGEMQQGCVDYLLYTVENVIRPQYLFSMNTLYQDRDLLYESISEDSAGEGNKVALNVGPRWWPEFLSLSTGESPGVKQPLVYRNAATILLSRCTEPSERLVSRLISHAAHEIHGTGQWLKYMFFAALWTNDVDIIDEFLAGLRHWMVQNRIDRMGGYHFENIGEVIHLKKRRILIGNQSCCMNRSEHTPV